MANSAMNLSDTFLGGEGLDANLVNHIYNGLIARGLSETEAMEILQGMVEDSGLDPYAQEGLLSGVGYDYNPFLDTGMYDEVDRQLDDIAQHVVTGVYNPPERSADQFVADNIKRRLQQAMDSFSNTPVKDRKRTLNEKDEGLFRNWYDMFAQRQGLSPDPDDPEQHYDYRGWWEDATEYDRANARNTYGAHLSDRYKLPGHETFSDESIYYDPSKPETTGGHWNPDGTFTNGPANPGYAVPYVFDQEDFDNRQFYMESDFGRFSDSPKGARGPWQIMPSTEADYVKSTGKSGNIYSQEYAKGVRDWYMDWLYNHPNVTMGNPTEENRRLRQVVAYNGGIGYLGNYLRKLAAQGVDIDNSTDWIEGVKPESRDYGKFIVLHQDTPKRTNETYQDSLSRYLAQNKMRRGGKLVNRFETGGPEKSNWFTRATLNAAMADAPAVMQSSGWDYDKNGNLVQGDPNAEGPSRLSEALELASLAANAPDLMESVPAIAKGAYNVIRHPAQAVKTLKTAIGETFGMAKDMNGLIRRGSQFRIVDSPAIEDAIESGLIRSKTGLYHGVPEYLESTFPEYMKQINGWQKMTSDEIIENLEKLGAFKDMTPKEAFVAKMPIRESTNHGGTVGYFKDTPYPNYNVSKRNYVIETPTSAEHFAPGHHGRVFEWSIDDPRTGATVLIDGAGNARGASITTKGSSYWEYSPFWDMWKNKKFSGGGALLYPYNRFRRGGRKRRGQQNQEPDYDAYVSSHVPEVMLTPSEAVSLNKDTPNNAFMQMVGDEFYYPEELQQAVLSAGMTPSEEREALQSNEVYNANAEQIRKTNSISPYVGGALAASFLTPAALEAIVAAPGAIGGVARVFRNPEFISKAGNVISKVPKVATDLLGFELVDMLPTLAGGNRYSSQIANAAESGFRWMTPDGKFEESVAPWVHSAGEIAGFMPSGLAGNYITQNLYRIPGMLRKVPGALKSVGRSIANEYDILSGKKLKRLGNEAEDLRSQLERNNIAYFSDKNALSDISSSKTANAIKVDTRIKQLRNSDGFLTLGLDSKVYNDMVDDARDIVVSAKKLGIVEPDFTLKDSFDIDVLLDKARFANNVWDPIYRADRNKILGFLEKWRPIMDEFGDSMNEPYNILPPKSFDFDTSVYGDDRIPVSFMDPRTGRSVSGSYESSGANSVHLTMPTGVVSVDYSTPTIQNRLINKYIENSFGDIGSGLNLGAGQADGNLKIYLHQFDPYMEVSGRRIPVSGDTKEVVGAMHDYLDYIRSRVGRDGLVGGSGILMENGEVAGIPGDVDFITDAAGLDKIKKAFNATRNRSLGGAAGENVSANDFLGGSADISVIENSESGKAIGKEALEFYSIMDPKGFREMMKVSADTGTDIGSMELPVTPRQIIDFFNDNPEMMRLKTRVDTFGSYKDKHFPRVINMMFTLNDKEFNATMDAMVGRYLNDFRKAVDVYPNLRFDDVVSNKEYLKKLGISGKQAEDIASDPGKMRRLVELQHVQESISTRSIDRSKLPSDKTLADAILTNSPTRNSATAGSRGGGNTMGMAPSGGGRYFGNTTGIIQSRQTFHPEKIKTPMDLQNMYDRLRSSESGISKAEAEFKEAWAKMKRGIDGAMSFEELQKFAESIARDLDTPVLKSGISNGGGSYTGRYSASPESYNIMESGDYGYETGGASRLFYEDNSARYSRESVVTKKDMLTAGISESDADMVMNAVADVTRAINDANASLSGMVSFKDLGASEEALMKKVDAVFDVLKKVDPSFDFINGQDLINSILSMRKLAVSSDEYMKNFMSKYSIDDVLPKQKLQAARDAVAQYKKAMKRYDANATRLEENIRNYEKSNKELSSLYESKLKSRYNATHERRNHIENAAAYSAAGAIMLPIFSYILYHVTHPFQYDVEGPSGPGRPSVADMNEYMRKRDSAAVANSIAKGVQENTNSELTQQVADMFSGDYSAALDYVKAFRAGKE